MYHDILVLLPIKSPSEVKKRLKSTIKPVFHKFINQLIIESLFNTIRTLRVVDVPFGVISPSTDILTKCISLGASFTFKDNGNGLNVALTDALPILCQQKPDIKKILILMPDLPFIDEKTLRELFNKINEYDVVIVPSLLSKDSTGTTAIFFRTTLPIKFVFGSNSYHRFKRMFSTSHISFTTFVSDKLSHDLDTIEDFQYLLTHQEKVGFLDKIDRILNNKELIECLN